MGKIIAVAISKGGVGKTTTALNLAFAFAIKHKRTLLIDVDPSGACSSSLGFQPSIIKGDIFNVIGFSKSINQVIHKTDNSYLDIIPLNPLSYKDEERFSKLTINKYLLSNIIRPESFFYDFILIDCPPVLSGTTTAALVAADSVLMPIRADKFSLQAVKRMMDHILNIKRTANSKLSVEGILFTAYESNIKVTYKVKKELILKYPNYLLRTNIPKNVDITEANFQLKPVMDYNPSAKSSIAYLALAKEIIENSSFQNIEVHGNT